MKVAESLTREKNMPRVLITAEVDDLEKWEKGFRTHGDLFRQMGVSSMEFGTSEGNRVAVCGETTNLDAYMKVFNSPATAAAMAFDGVKRETVKMFVLDKEVKV
jgi:hypothetical protein